MQILDHIIDDIYQRLTSDSTDIKEEDVQKFFNNFIKIDVPEKIKYGICCHGLTEIDDPDEQEKLATKIAKFLKDAIPSPYNAGYFLIEGLVEYLAYCMLKEAADMLGNSFCKGISCTMDKAPFPNPTV